MHERKMRAVLAATVLSASFVAAGCGGGGGGNPNALDVQLAAGATHCQYSGYDLISQITNVKTPIYDCHWDAVSGFAANDECVTYENGVASDSTGEVRVAFANALNSAEPACLG
jgi:hypothetical protein